MRLSRCLCDLHGCAGCAGCAGRAGRAAAGAPPAASELRNCAEGLSGDGEESSRCPGEGERWSRGPVWSPPTILWGEGKVVSEVWFV